MTIAILLLSFLLSWISNSFAAEPDLLTLVDLNNPAALEEATRVLAEEITLASRPNTYLLIDLAANAIVMKARGIELQRLLLSRWSAESCESMTGSYRLVARPSVARRKIDPVVAPEQEPVALADMPTHYHLDFDPSLAIDVIPPVDHAPLRWTLIQVKIRWQWLRSWLHSFSTDSSSPQPRLVLTLPENLAQSLAWSLVDGMPLVIRRPAH